MKMRFTDKETWVVAEIIARLKMDDWLLLNGENFFDAGMDEWLTLEEGLQILYEAIAYPLIHERIGHNDSRTFVSLLKEFQIGNEQYYDWLMSEDENAQR